MCQTAHAFPLNSLSHFITLMIYIFTSKPLNTTVKYSNIHHLLILMLLSSTDSGIWSRVLGSVQRRPDT